MIIRKRELFRFIFSGTKADLKKATFKINACCQKQGVQLCRLLEIIIQLLVLLFGNVP